MSKPEEQSTFFNVMPEAVNSKSPNSARQSAAGSPQATSRKVDASGTEKVFGSQKTAQSSISMPSRTRGLLRQKKVFIPLMLIVIALIGFAVWKFTSKSTPEPTQNREPIAVQQPADPDSTTSPEWLARYFGSETCTTKTTCGDSADPDRDGLTNKEEFEKGTDPNNPDSDSDGLADGDEFHIFQSDQLLSRTFREGQYNDPDFVKGGYDVKTNTAYTPDQLATIKSNIKERGLHQPTLTTIGAVALTLYDFKDPNASDLDSLNIDKSPQAQLDRDTQRQSTIKKVGGALLKYKTSKKTYPKDADFLTMSETIAPFNTVATNYNDPINKEKYIYGYESLNNGLDFTMTYFSETQNQLIKYSAKNAEETALKENAQINNEQRIADLENIKSALMIYSSANIDSNSDKINVFPTKDQYPFALLPRYISAIPKDPNGAEYEYTSADPYDKFTLKAIFQAPPAGVTGYMCNETECKNY